MHGEENALTKTICGSYRETIYDCHVLASKRADSSSGQAGNPNRPFLGHTGRNEAPRVETGAETEVKAEREALAFFSVLGFSPKPGGHLRTYKVRDFFAILLKWNVRFVD